MKKHSEFLKNAILGKKVGAIARSSKYVIQNVIKQINNYSHSTVVEYGPGDGVLTTELLKNLSADGKILLVELDKNFVKILKNIDDSRIRVVNGSIQDISKNLPDYGFNKVDIIISSIPFSLIDKKEREEIVKNSFDALAPGGKLIVFHQYSTLMLRPIKKYFTTTKVIFEPRNILPCFIIVATKV